MLRIFQRKLNLLHRNFKQYYRFIFFAFTTYKVNLIDFMADCITDMAGWFLFSITCTGLAIATFVPPYKVVFPALPQTLPWHLGFKPLPPHIAPAPAHVFPPHALMKKHYMHKFWKYNSPARYYSLQGLGTAFYGPFRRYPRTPIYGSLPGQPTLTSGSFGSPYYTPTAPYFRGLSSGLTQAPRIVSGRSLPRSMLTGRPVASLPIGGALPFPANNINTDNLNNRDINTRNNNGHSRRGPRVRQILSQRQGGRPAIGGGFISLREPSMLPRIPIPNIPKPLDLKPIPDAAKSVDIKTGPTDKGPVLPLAPALGGPGDVPRISVVPNKPLDLPVATDVLPGPIPVPGMVPKDNLLNNNVDIGLNGGPVATITNQDTINLSLTQDIPARRRILDSVLDISLDGTKLTPENTGLQMLDIATGTLPYPARDYNKRKVNGATLYSVRSGPDTVLGGPGSNRMPDSALNLGGFQNNIILDQVPDLAFIDNTPKFGNTRGLNSNDLYNGRSDQSLSDMKPISLSSDLLGIDLQPSLSGLSAPTAVDISGSNVITEIRVPSEHKGFDIKIGEGFSKNQNSNSGIVRIVGQNNIIPDSMSVRSSRMRMLGSDFSHSEKGKLHSLKDGVKMQAFVDSHGVTRILNSEKSSKCFDKKLNMIVSCD